MRLKNSLFFSPSVLTNFSCIVVKQGITKYIITAISCFSSQQHSSFIKSYLWFKSIFSFDFLWISVRLWTTKFCQIVSGNNKCSQSYLHEISNPSQENRNTLESDEMKDGLMLSREKYLRMHFQWKYSKNTHFSHENLSRCKLPFLPILWTAKVKSWLTKLFRIFHVNI